MYLIFIPTLQHTLWIVYVVSNTNHIHINKINFINIIIETAMGTSVNAQENPNNEYVQAIKNILNIVMSRSFSSWKRFDFLFQFSKEYQLQNKSINTINNLTKSVIKKQRNALIKASVNGNANEDKNEDNIRIKKHALLDLLLVSTIDGKLLTDDDITEEVNTFLAAVYIYFNFYCLQ